MTIIRQYDNDKYETQKTKRIPKRSTTLVRSIRKLLEGLKIFDGTNLTLISDQIKTHRCLARMKDRKPLFPNARTIGPCVGMFLSPLKSNDKI